MASTHTEIYRPFQGRLRSGRLRFVPLYLADLRTMSKRRVALILVLAVPAIAGIVFSFIVYGKYALESGVLPGSAQPGVGMAASMAGKLIQVREQVAEFTIQCRYFALLAIAWFGAGLIADDRKAGAQLLYFSRPLSKLDYFLGHFCAVATFGLYAVLVPGLLICVVAGFSSPEYVFFVEEWDVLLATLGYAAIFVVVVASLTLALSSLFRRKSHALVALFLLVAFNTALGFVLRRMNRDSDFLIASLWGNFQRLAYWMFGVRQDWLTWDPRHSLAVLGGVTLASLAVLGWRLRRMEVVG